MKAGPCALYRCWAVDGHLLYVGCSSSPLIRMKQHESFRSWATAIASVTLEWFPDKRSALTAEKAAIAVELPEWNIHGRPNPKRSAGRFNGRFHHDDRATWVHSEISEHATGGQ